MVAAAITPTVVQKTYEPSIGKTGTSIRLVKYFFKLTKATDGDWLVTATHLQAGTPVKFSAVTIDSSSDGVVESATGLTYTSTGTKLTLSGGTTGTTYGEVWYTE